MSKLLVFLALLAGGCELETLPYLREHRVGDLPKHWAAAGPGVGGTKAVTVYNPHDHSHLIEVVCDGDAGEGWGNFEVVVPAHGEHRRLVTVHQNRLVGETCFIKSVAPPDPKEVW